MLRFLMILMCVFFAFSFDAQAQTEKSNPDRFTIDLARDHVDITTGFNGAELVIFGMKDEPGDIALVVMGPPREMVVRRKGRVLGIWMNNRAVKFDDVPVYYDFAVSKPEIEMASQDILRRNQIGLDALEFKTGNKMHSHELQKFREALARNKQIQGHFPLEPKGIVFLNNNFFRANFYVPPDVPTGDYVIKAYLFRDGELSDTNLTQLRVAQVGFSAGLYRFAHDYSIFYGLFGVMFACFAGWMAYVLMRKE